MTGDLGTLGFWLFLAAVVVASIWKGRSRESDIQATIRAAMDKDGKVDPALLELLRARDAAAHSLEREKWGLSWKPNGPATAAITLFILLFVLGIILFLILSPPLPSTTIPLPCMRLNPPPFCDDLFHPRSVALAPKLVAFAALAAVWLGGFGAAAWIIHRYGKKGPPPAA
jgi:hypothetical protein